MKRIHHIYASLALGFLLIITHSALGQKLVSEGTIKYSLEVLGGDQDATLLTGTEITIYVKGPQSRQDRMGKLGKETSVYDARTAQGKILKSYAGQDLMIDLSKEEWKGAKLSFQKMKFMPSNQMEEIGKYNCQVAIAHEAAGYQYKLYYDPSIAFSNRDFEFSFGEIQGLPVRIEIITSSTTFRYNLINYNTDPVSYGVFDLPKGYRSISYKDFILLQKGKKN